ncbi:MAG: 3-methyl-2-oxobutanoate hydroxymethyltransferase, partial [Sphingomonadales bacterium]
APKKRKTIPELQARKGGEPIVCLTAYTTPMARLLDDTCDLLLVGDSVGMVLYGMGTTLGVTLDMMIQHGAAVVRGSEEALIVIDMPFGTYEESPSFAFRNAADILARTGAQGVKLEGGVEMAPTIEFLVKRGIPVMAHIGLRPQSVNTLGGFKAQGREEAEWTNFMADAHSVSNAGAFAIVLEAVAEPLAHKITKIIPTVTIGIGASPDCDGQILVTDDMLGMGDWSPKFVKRYADLKGEIRKAAQKYAEEVRARKFPELINTFKMKK